MIFKSYVRIFTNNMESTLQLLKRLSGQKIDLRFSMENMGLEVVALGSFCVVAGSEEALGPIRSSLGPIVVDDLAATQEILVHMGSTITMQQSQGPTGKFLYAKHPDGSIVEYVQWNDETTERMSQLSRRIAK